MSVDALIACLRETTKQNVMKKSKYFKIQELVCPDVFKRFGENAWMFIDHRLIETLDIVREKILCKPIIVNNWSVGGSFTQRGLRCNMCQVVKSKSAENNLYLSAHTFGKAIDASIQGMTGEEARKLIIKNQILLPWPIRLEERVSWLHLDVYDAGQAIYQFKG